MNIGIIGYGDFGQQLEMLLLEAEPNNCVIPFDDNNSTYAFKDYEKNINSFSWLIGLGYKHMETRVQIIKKIKEKKGLLKNIIHKSSYVSPSAIVKNGLICYPMCNIDNEVEIRSGVLLHNSVVISHNTIIGEGCYISPGVVICGNVQIGEGCFIGGGTVISDSITIGSYSKIGIGSVITKNIPANSWVIGNPQRFLNQPFEL